MKQRPVSSLTRVPGLAQAALLEGQLKEGGGVAESPGCWPAFLSPDRMPGARDREVKMTCPLPSRHSPF